MTTARPSVARARSTYSPGFVKVAVVTALPSFTGVDSAGSNTTPAGPRHTIQLTDSSGEQILSLGLGDGVAYESLEPSDASIALTAAD